MGKKKKATDVKTPWTALVNVSSYCKDKDCNKCESLSALCVAAKPPTWNVPDTVPATGGRTDTDDAAAFKTSMKEVQDFCMKIHKETGCRNCPFNKNRKCIVNFPYARWSFPF